MINFEENFTDVEESGSESDVTVEEIDVCLNRETEEDLYVIQFPTFSRNIEPSFLTPTKASFRRTNKELRLFFDTKRDEQYFEVPESSEQELAREIVFKSSKIVHFAEKVDPQYAIAVFDKNDKVLHLTPVQQILTMTPDLSRLDQVKAKTTSTENHEDKGPKNVEVYVRKETEQAAEYRKRSFKYIKEQIDKEAFVEIEIAPPKETNEYGIAEELLCQQPYLENEGFGISTQKYFNKIASCDNVK